MTLISHKPITHFELLNYGKIALQAVSYNPLLESELILAHITQCKKEDLIKELSVIIQKNTIISDFCSFIEKRKTNEPLAYLLNTADFMTRSYYVNKTVLIPRPETELLVEKAISIVNNLEQGQKLIPILELGFGSGVVGLELALAFNKQKVFAWDISSGAHHVAMKNQEIHGAPNIQFFCHDFFSDSKTWSPLLCQPGHKLIVSNPPYIPSNDILSLDSSVKDYEPIIALDGGIDGLDFYRRLFDIAAKYPETILVLEIGIDQHILLAQILKGYSFQKVFFEKDFNNIHRILIIQ